ncbi:hypothetical protein RvY_08929-3 [Ramazzottius varieornatus]|uniref:Uncharacterized protein n=1 Tax=Ramazzottius varieornatus TaxID=947166 RepID=A0A1D1V7P9_RAMVA|nr:hypothetical protein RvY_08929-3 [Ramazzottius varieornatus]
MTISAQKWWKRLRGIFTAKDGRFLVAGNQDLASSLTGFDVLLEVHLDDVQKRPASKSLSVALIAKRLARLEVERQPSVSRKVASETLTFLVILTAQQMVPTSLPTSDLRENFSVSWNIVPGWSSPSTNRIQ